MPRGRGRGSACRVGKSSVRGNLATRENMATVPIPTINPQQGGTSSSGGPDHINQVQTLGPSSTPHIQTSGHDTPTINLEPSPNTPNQSNTIGEGTSSQSNIIGKTECSSTHRPQMLLTISPTGLLKRVEIQHQVSCICTSILMVMMENLLLLKNPELYMRYYSNKHKLNLTLISVKHIIKPPEEKRKEEYMVLDRKQNATMGQIFMALLDLMLHRQQHLQILNQHRQGIWMS
uniref:Uncharacterized protein isoform X2 n=1 Tax=Nicotiana tabacum TaxID=4097 RepID=A0A1S4CBW1_TOBAC|nr:PREDICTED: uncharacterized protein LOC107817335 isoform X2 [Nicotiana tabacum]